MKPAVICALILQVLCQHIESMEENHVEDLAEELATHPESFDPVPDPFEQIETTSYVTQWAEKIGGLEIADMITVEIEPRATLELFEEISQLPAALKGAYFASSHENVVVAVKIVDPGLNVVYEHSGEREGLFALEAKSRGLHQFIFTNKQVLSTVVIRENQAYDCSSRWQHYRGAKQRPHHSC
jgi:hypothetical protein